MNNGTISREEYTRRLNEPLVRRLQVSEIELAICLAREYGGQTVLAAWCDWQRANPGHKLGHFAPWLRAHADRYTEPESTTDAAPEPPPTDPFAGVRERLHMPAASSAKPTQGALL